MAVDEGLKIELGKHGVLVTTIEELYNWGRRISICPMQFGLACCAIEMIATTIGPIRPGTLWRRSLSALAPPGRHDDHLRHCDQEDGSAGGEVLYNQMAEPKYVIAMEDPAHISIGPFMQGYYVL